MGTPFVHFVCINVVCSPVLVIPPPYPEQKLCIMDDSPQNSVHFNPIVEAKFMGT